LDGDAPQLSGRNANTGPAAVTSESVLLSLDAFGYDGEGFDSGIILQLKANEDWNTGSHGTRFDFWTVQDGTTSFSKVMTLDHDGALILGTDPGGSQLLRVGGTSQLQGSVQVTGSVNILPSGVASDRQAAFAENFGGGSAAVLAFSGSGPHGIEIHDGGFESAFYYRTTPNQWIFEQADGTDLLRIDNDDGLVEIPVGDLVIGTDPGGSELVRIAGDIKMGGSDAGRFLTMFSSGDHFHSITGDGNRSTSVSALLRLTGNWNGDSVAEIHLTTGNDTTNKDDGRILLRTQPDNATGVQTRMAIDANGTITVSTGPLIIGTDPGGSQTLRVGGTAVFNNRVTISGSGHAFEAIRIPGDLTDFREIFFNGGRARFGYEDSAAFIAGSSGKNIKLYTNGAIPETGSAHLELVAGGDSTFRTGSVIVGTDPGGGEKLRVSGSIRAEDDGTGIIVCRSNLGGNIRMAVNSTAAYIQAGATEASDSRLDIRFTSWLAATQYGEIDGATGRWLIGPADPGGSSENLRLSGSLQIAHSDSQIFMRLFRPDLTANERKWDVRVDDGADLEIRSIQDGGTTVSHSLNIKHQTGEVQFPANGDIRMEGGGSLTLSGSIQGPIGGTPGDSLVSGSTLGYNGTDWVPVAP
jgi:hypothetical protein